MFSSLVVSEKDMRVYMKAGVRDQHSAVGAILCDCHMFAGQAHRPAPTISWFWLVRVRRCLG